LERIAGLAPKKRFGFIIKSKITKMRRMD